MKIKKPIILFSFVLGVIVLMTTVVSVSNTRAGGDKELKAHRVFCYGSGTSCLKSMDTF